MREYEIEIHGIPHTVQLDDAEAKRLGLFGAAPTTKQQAPPANKQATPAKK